jgi:hypothetical protein
MLFTFAVSLALTATTPTAAATTDAPAEAPVKKEKPKKICRTDTMDTGSRIAKKVCKTEEEWRKGVDDQEIRTKGKTIGG